MGSRPKGNKSRGERQERGTGNRALGSRIWFLTKGKHERGEDEVQGPGWQEVDCRTEYNCCVLAKGGGEKPLYL